MSDAARALELVKKLNEEASSENRSDTEDALEVSNLD